jgi:hypothetical protein
MKRQFRFTRKHSDPERPKISPEDGDAPIHQQPVATCPLQQVIGSQDNLVLKCMATIATNAWKAKTKMLDSATGEVRDDMKRVYRHIEGIMDSLEEMGIEVKDHTGDTFDYGLLLKVVTTQPTPGITKEKVIETIKPTVYCQKTSIIQRGEVVIATPIQQEEKP